MKTVLQVNAEKETLFAPTRDHDTWFERAAADLSRIAANFAQACRGRAVHSFLPVGESLLITPFVSK